MLSHLRGLESTIGVATEGPGEGHLGKIGLKNRFGNLSLLGFR